MNKIKKLLISLTAAALAATNVIGLASCFGDGGGSKVNTGDVEVVAYDGSAVTVTFYHCMGQSLKGILADCIADFNQLYPNIKITDTSFGDYPGVRDQITTELSAGRAPSLAYCYPDHVALYNKSKAVMTLDGYIASELEATQADGTKEIMGLTQAQKDDYVPFYYDEGKIYGDGKMYTLPMLKSTELLYYNKTYFAEHELTVPTTWDEMEAVCQQILDIESAKEGGLEANRCIPLGYDSGANWFITMTEQLDSKYTSSEKGSYFLFNNEENRAFVKKFKEWYDKGYVTTEDTFGSYTSDLFTQTEAGKTKAYMCIGSSAGATYQRPDLNPDGQTYPFEVGVTMVPQEDPENPKMISQGPSLCLFKKDNPQEVAAAWLFAKYITTSVEYQARFSMNNGYACAIQSVKDNPVYANFLQKADGGVGLQASAVQLTMNYKDYYYVSPAFNGSSTARDEMATLMKNCFQQDPKSGETEDQMIERLFKDCYDKLKKKYDR